MRSWGENQGRVYAVLVTGMIGIVAAGCSSTIHIDDQVGRVDTLSVDAKQRLMLVGNRGGISPKRVTCTEPMPDAIVAQAAFAAGNANVNNPNGISGNGAFAGGSSESAASIGFRNQTVQMLRDGYFRLCEAYLNGALTKEEYQHMMLNADTFMVVVSALQILGSNPYAPAVTISAGSVNASATPGGEVKGGITVPNGDANANTTANAIQTKFPDAPGMTPEQARMAARIDDSNLRYRATLGARAEPFLRQSAKRDREAQPE